MIITDMLYFADEMSTCLFIVNIERETFFEN